MSALYFRITEPPDPLVFERGWVEVDSDHFALDRTVWRAACVSRRPDECAALRHRAEDRSWELRNMATDRLVILYDGHQRYELRRGMSMTLWPGPWRGTLTGAFTFELSARRPDAPVRRSGGTGGASADRDDTRPRRRVTRARRYLGAHPTKRLALALLWRRHLEHTLDVAEDLTSAAVARAFGVSAGTVTGWREELAEHVFEERGHQQAVRDLVVTHGVMTRADVADALRYLGAASSDGAGRRTVETGS